MLTFDIICLAKSTKLGGICLAGIKTDGTGWLRPISNRRDGTLYPEHYTTRDGQEPELFDIIRIPFIRHEPKCHHPENWLIHYSDKWQILGKATLKQAQILLKPEIKQSSSQPQLLGNFDRRIRYEDLQISPIKSSLTMINPEQLKWEIKYNSQKKKSFRCLFSLCGNSYDLPITDPIWIDKLSFLEEGIYSCEEIIEKLNLDNFEPDKFRLTISLSEPFQPSSQSEEIFCYKLVASVINVADTSKRLGWK
ncbi:hypothetical protein MEN41_05310 [Dolichospermum sp. ST_con]|nr:hypothetical protein [Dolichospermum sp. ST_con]MDD1418538.1 hypothetical protein [Dolichospermum sp. ST_sed1]MDD1423879.1 hypothetical protein [Dolichospermum sp. ST_sed9]MDD1431592.1 hypothetical protein [Dolichospermum sp. ST_sed6]MDD1436091.1 hypothetical protein [Dolichospermum sp. ST_sed10]MDD1440861.1 hypothetical protein [Dolichospermum sp. ST_sed3]MDD1447007.1 hypothetical protein [Dolichospermum sp. ST_sed8]MDD1454165.1 hypothetical protein [Dolichospermum sp. ST_sed7]MDD145875